MSRYARQGRISRRVGELSSKYCYQPEQLEEDIKQHKEQADRARESFKAALSEWEKANIAISREGRKSIIVAVLLEKWKREGLI